MCWNLILRLVLGFTFVAIHAQASLETSLSSSVRIESIKKSLLLRLNEDRREHGLRPLKRDLTAEKSGDQHCAAQLEIGSFLGHYSLNGHLPYMRYSLAGGAHAHSENIAFKGIALEVATLDPQIKCRRNSNWPVPNSQNVSELVREMALQLHCEMLNENPPHDGHRKAILNPLATHVGIGLSFGVVEKPERRWLQVYLCQEFTSQIVEFLVLPPLEVSYKRTGRRTKMAFRIPKGYEFAHFQLHYEAPKPKTAREAGRLLTYALPKRFFLHLPAPGENEFYPQSVYEKYPGLKTNVKVEGSLVEIPIEFQAGPGVYTSVAWIKKKGDDSQLIPVSSRSTFVR